MELGNHIKALRQQRGVTQETLAAALGVSAQAVSKWENQAAAPDIQLLPAISTYFGVTIDELFALSDETRMERIQNMLWDERDLDSAVVEREAAFLLDKARREPENYRAYSLLAELENHRADTCRRRAAEYAKLSISRHADNMAAFWELAYSKSLVSPYYELADSHREIIDYLKEFIDQNPTAASGSAHQWLIEALLWDYRFKEAMEVCEKMGEVDHTCLVPYFRGLIIWKSGDRDGALKIWEQMVKDCPEEDDAWGLYAEGYVMTGDYAGAVKLLEKAQTLEKEPTTTYWEMGALYRELDGDIPGAIRSMEEILKLKAAWGQTEGAGVDAVRREIERLKEKQKAEG